MPVLLNLPAFAIVMFVTWLLLRGAKETATANTVMVVIKLAVLALFIAVGVMNINPANYTPFAPNGFTGIHQGAAIVFFAYIGFDAISTAAEETRNPQRNLPMGILGGLAICTVIYVIVGAVITGMVPYTELGVADPLARALELIGYSGVGAIVAFGATVSMAAVLLVFQYGQPRIFFAMARDGLMPEWVARVDPENAHSVRRDARHRYRRRGRVDDRRRRGDLRPDQHRDAVRVRAGVRGRPGAAVMSSPTVRGRSRCLMSGFIAPLGVAACLFIMVGLPTQAWIVFGWWLLIGTDRLRHLRLSPQQAPPRAANVNGA